jgi:hypothetical protein
MAEQSGITVEDIKEWRDLEVTCLFFEYVKVHLEDDDNRVHGSLENNLKDEAALFNAGMSRLHDVMEIPERMIEDLKEET